MFIEVNRSRRSNQQLSSGESDNIGIPTRISLVVNESGYSFTSPTLSAVEKGIKRPVLLANNDKEKDKSTAHKEAAKEVGKDAAAGAAAGAAGGWKAGGLKGAAAGAAGGGLINAGIGFVRHCGACHGN